MRELEELPPFNGNEGILERDAGMQAFKYQERLHTSALHYFKPAREDTTSDPALRSRFAQYLAVRRAEQRPSAACRQKIMRQLQSSRDRCLRELQDARCNVSASCRVITSLVAPVRC